MTWLVTGGAGYIGAHAVRAFRNAEIDVVVVDSLASGSGSFVPADVPLVRASVLDSEMVQKAIVEHDVVGVVHLAGFKYAGVSVERPYLTYEQNVNGTVRLLEAMHETGVDKMVFSSSAAIFGPPTSRSSTSRRPRRPSRRMPRRS